MEIVEDVSKALRYVRAHADRFGVDPERLAAIGASSGGHLALMLACKAGSVPSLGMAAGPARLRAVAAFSPVTDLLDLGASTENPGNGGPPRSFVQAFGPDATNLDQWRRIGRAVSPIYHVHPSCCRRSFSMETLTP